MLALINTRVDTIKIRPKYGYDRETIFVNNSGWQAMVFKNGELNETIQY